MKKVITCARSSFFSEFFYANERELWKLVINGEQEKDPCNVIWFIGTTHFSRLMRFRGDDAIHSFK